MAKNNPILNAPTQSNLMGIGFMLLHTLSLSVLYALVKNVTEDLDAALMVFLYKFAILIIALPWCFSGGIQTLKTKRIKLHMSRALLSTLGSLSMFYALKHVPLGDVSAVTKLEQIFLLIIGIIYFKEKITKTKIGVIFASFLGALMIIRSDLFTSAPSEQSLGFNSYYVFVLLAIFFWSINSTVIKVLGQTEKTKVQLFYVMLLSSIISFPVAFMNWKTSFSLGPIDVKYPIHLKEIADLGFQTKHIKYILLVALCYFGHVVGMFKAFKHAELSIVVPLEYTRLVMAGIFGYVFFFEVPTQIALYGYFLIIAAGLYLFYSEHRRSRKRKRREEAEQLKEEYDQQ